MNKRDLKTRVVLMLSLLGAAIFAYFQLSQTTPVPKPASTCWANMVNIEAAKQQWASAENKRDNEQASWSDLRPYLSAGSLPKCSDGGDYTIGRLNEKPKCSVGGWDHSYRD